MIEALGGTMLIDKADFQDSNIGTDIAKILNCGYQKSLPVTRMEQTERGYVPRIYDVFGPKIINGRRPFQDDATESRCLIHTPVLTERTDIPLQLPEDFEEQARHIRNMALKWRFENLDAFRPESLIVEQVRPRTSQIIMPLLLIAQRMGPRSRGRYWKDLVEYARRMEVHALEERKESVEAWLIQAFMDHHHSTPPTCKDLADAVAKEYSAIDPKIDRRLTPKKVGSILKSLGFSTTHSKRGAVVSIEPKRLTALQRRYGIVTQSSVPSSLAGDHGDGRVIIAEAIVTSTNSRQ